MPYSALDVARCFIHTAASAQDEAEYLSPMRLQKLLYYAQGWHLALRGEPLFGDTIEAWQHGPVVRAVFKEFQEYGGRSIDVEKVPQHGLAPDASAFVANVWESYKHLSALALSAMTHSEPPWCQARAGLSLNSASDRPIAVDAMREYFTSLEKSGGRGQRRQA
jgi:uncharacterized phage-associated protein